MTRLKRFFRTESIPVEMAKINRAMIDERKKSFIFFRFSGGQTVKLNFESIKLRKNSSFELKIYRVNFFRLKVIYSKVNSIVI